MQGSHDQVWRQVSQEIARAQGYAAAEALQPEHTPLSALGLDSLKLIEIVYELETFYQLDVDEERLAELNRVGDLIDLIVTALAVTDDPSPAGGTHGTHL
tara:strand:+ start:1333 stop:1632 length:300 start_codon:yes stop_codon:yes gene_type:complete